MGISPGDGRQILEYPEASWFVKELHEARRKEKVYRLLDDAEALRMAFIGASSVDGFKKYQDWCNRLKSTVEDQRETGEATLFDQLKKQTRQKKPKTLFDRLRR